MPQFNGKQEGHVHTNRPNLRCPRNGKQTSAMPNLGAASAFIFHHWVSPDLVSPATGFMPGKVMKVDLPARIPANKAEVRLPDAFS